jgi:peroxiredoxin
MTLKIMYFRWVVLFAVTFGCVFVGPAGAYAQAADSDIAPQYLDAQGQAGYREFLLSGTHKAFAIAPGGAWAWVSDMPDPDVAESEAIRNCSGYSEQSCTIYAIDGQIVFDADEWAASWGPYADSAQAASRAVSTARGGRFPDLALTAPDGGAVTLSDLRGKIVFLHFWGSWCAPCQFEFPDVQKLYDSFGEDDGIAFVLVQSREDIERSRRWAKQRKFSMPFYDSGARGPADHAFAKADGGIIEDRFLVPVFPSTYILDSQGLVLFSQFGPQENWSLYEPLLRHAVEHRPD